MDSQRLGKVLGVGARHAAKTLVSAIDAASAPSPSSPASPSPPRQTTSAPRNVPSSARVVTPHGNSRGVAEGARRFGRAVWEPAARLSGVLWLEVTGLFFALFALVAAIAAWHLRGSALPLHGSPAPDATTEHTRFLLACAMLLVFGYFAGSSFLRANRRSRRR